MRYGEREVDLLDRVLNMAMAVQQIPAPPFAEADRADFVRMAFLKENLSNVEVDEIGNVYARIRGKETTSPIVVSAHLDTVFPAETDLRLVRDPDHLTGPGIGDNSLGVAALFALAWEFGQRSNLPKDIWLVANVGEEGLGNLRGMRRIVDRFGETPRAYLILEGMGLGKVFHRGLGVRRYRITTRCPGGHSWVDRGEPSALHELARLVTRLTAIPLPKQPATSLNVGVIAGGSGVNVIAAEAYIELDLRSEENRALHELVECVCQLAGEMERENVQVEIQLIGERPAGDIPATHPLVQLAANCLQMVGEEAHLSIGSTDANVPLSMGLPAICIGLTRGEGAHSMKECIQIHPLETGLRQLFAIVEGILAGLM